jgi:hypothetical protein
MQDERDYVDAQNVLAPMALMGNLCRWRWQKHQREFPLPLGVIRLDPPAVIAGSEGLDPVAMLQAPAHGAPQAPVETVSLHPAEIALALREVDRAALVVTGAVGDEPDEDGVGRSGLDGLLGAYSAQPMHQVDDSPLGLHPDVVGLPRV